jgi:hypothetical protein
MALAIVRSGNRKRASSLTVHANPKQPEDEVVWLSLGFHSKLHLLR